jgi:hypothetical protein
MITPRDAINVIRRSQVHKENWKLVKHEGISNQKNTLDLHATSFYDS